MGFQTLDRLAVALEVRFQKPWLARYLFAKKAIEDQSICLVKPMTYMNRSGLVFPAVLRRTGVALEGIVVVCDTLDLPPGVCRLRRKGSSAGHRGLASIIDVLGTTDFKRLYIGIGHPGQKSEVISYVLGTPQSDRVQIERGLETAAESILRLMGEPPERVMNDLNNKNS